jgi:hypothetical protein
MTSSSSTDCSDLVQVAKSSHKVQCLAEDLTRYFNPKDIVAATHFAKVECAYDETKVLDEVKEEFKREFRKSKKVTMNLLTKTYTNWMECRSPTLSMQSSLPLSGNSTFLPEYDS